LSCNERSATAKAISVLSGSAVINFWNSARASFEAFLRDQDPRVREARFPRLGIILEIVGKDRGGLIHRGLLQQLRFEHNRLFGVGPQAPRLPDFVERESIVPGVRRHSRHGEVRLRKLGVVCGEALRKPERGLLVLGGGEHAGKQREPIRRIAVRAGQQLLEIGQRLVVAADGDQPSPRELEAAR